MTLELQETDGRRLYVAKEGHGVLGYIAIDSMIDGRARGGLRMLPDVSADEIRDAARAMTLKYGFLGLPQGGAKAGVRGDPEAEAREKQAQLVRFAKVAQPLLTERVYIPDTDLGTRTEDIQAMMRSVGARPGRRHWRTTRSGYYTALSCLISAEAALAHRHAALEGQRVAIEGFGSVGSHLAQLLESRGATVVAVSTSQGAIFDPAGLDIDGLIRSSATHGSAFVHQVDPGLQIERAGLLELPVDLLCPCARRHSIHETNASAIQAPVICSGANDPVSPEAEQWLETRGTLVLPEFVTNSGGVLGGTMDFAGVEDSAVTGLFESFYRERISTLLDAVDGERRSPRTLATQEALERHARVRQACEDPALAGRLFGLGLEVYRRGWLPRSLVGLLSPTYMRRLLRR